MKKLGWLEGEQLFSFLFFVCVCGGGVYSLNGNKCHENYSVSEFHLKTGTTVIIFKMLSKAGTGLMLLSYADTQSKQTIYIPQLSHFSNLVEFVLLNMFSCKKLRAYFIRI